MQDPLKQKLPKSIFILADFPTAQLLPEHIKCKNEAVHYIMETDIFYQDLTFNEIYEDITEIETLHDFYDIMSTYTEMGTF